ncbi:hypothetical protein T11_5510 [Trichinella zimbabwensis]|uniref:Uncharacterized protein n=1 Tax=Trichinella zimbabwensis TaxID=268475 RepID=A0A0V1HKG1_9BILA|nr:hypothetical protein T11_5510 [Trichinella zimbabwensis]
MICSDLKFIIVTGCNIRGINGQIDFVAATIINTLTELNPKIKAYSTEHVFFGSIQLYCI